MSKNNLSKMTEHASGPQKLSLKKNKLCSICSSSGEKSHQCVMEEGSFIESSKTQNQHVTELSASTQNEGDKSCVDLIYCPCCSVSL